MERSTPGWYSRPEVPGPWRMAACAEHGRFLAGHRFVPAPAPAGRNAPARCAICDRPETIDEVVGCTCEFDTARCPVHRIVGCGG